MSTTTRTDVHRPSALDPTQYAHIGEFYQGAEDEMYVCYAGEHAHLEVVLGSEWADETAPGGNYATKRTCDHCGTAFAYGSVYRHEPTGETIAVGHICAEKAMLPGVTAADRKRAQAVKAAKAAVTAKANAAYRELTLDENPGLAEAFEVDHYIIADIGRRFRSSTPELSEKQIALVLKIAAEQVVRAAERAEQDALAQPVVTGNGVVIEGKVLSTKYVDSEYGGALKMLVLDDRHFKVWGSVPSAISSVPLPEDDEDRRVNAERAAKGWDPIHTNFRGLAHGDRVRFTANVEASDDDETFGFFKRPRLAELLEAVTA